MTFAGQKADAVAKAADNVAKAQAADTAAATELANAQLTKQATADALVAALTEQTSVGAIVPDPVAPPVPVPPVITVSKDGATATAGVGSITNKAGNVFTVGADGHIYRNGVAILQSNGVDEIVYVAPLDLVAQHNTIDGQWWDQPDAPDAYGTHQIADPTIPVPTPTPAPLPTLPGGTVPAPPADPGWKIVANNNFDVHIPRGQFPGFSPVGMIEGVPWYSYVSGPGTSSYNSSSANTAVGDKYPGCLEINLLAHGASGGPEPAAPCPAFQSSAKGMKRKVRFRLVEGSWTGVGSNFWYPAWLFWPNSDIWSQGEIDCPEGGLNGQINAYIHDTYGNPGSNVVANEATGVRWDDHLWHESIIEWTPATGVKITLDGVLVASTPGNANGTPTQPMRVTYQSESRGTPQGDATILLDYSQISEPA
jgi:hypothetical protein